MQKSTCVRVFADAVQIENCKKVLADNANTFTSLGKIIELAGNEVRLKILFLLEEENELCPCDLSDILGMSVPAISQHLRKLKDGNIVQTRRSGQTIFYSLKPENLEILKPLFMHISNRSSKSIVS
ncbi:MAG: ArsR/SmtB family transcription factor [Flavobacterium sp.]